ncbi:MAG: amidohydrolase family protein [Alphaproteobacteria bacterium]|jgi:imidazolonepropionase-like amidohydrolase|nr:amidohydrolase family protein [Alphaproteobacteria bacterium]
MAVGLEDDLIIAVDGTGQFGSEWTDESVRTIDAKGMTVMPGLINMHDHLAMRDLIGNPIWEVEAGIVKLTLNGIRNALTALRRGWTTVRDLGAPDGIALKLRDLIAEGQMPGPRVIACGSPICVTGGHGWPVCAEVDGPDNVRRVAREQFKQGADYIKVMASGDPHHMPGEEQTIPEMTLAEIRAAFEEAELRGKHTACHAMGTTALANVLEAGVDVVSHGFYLNAELAERMARQGAYLDPTLSSYGIQTINPKRNRGEQWIEDHQVLLEPMKESFAAALAADVKIVVGTDTGGFFSEDLALMREFGMAPMDSLVAATKNCADAMKVGDRLGTIEQGKIADIVILGSDPLEDPHHIEDVVLVIKQGVAMRPDEINLDDRDFLAALR